MVTTQTIKNEGDFSAALVAAHERAKKRAGEPLISELMEVSIFAENARGVAEELRTLIPHGTPHARGLALTMLLLSARAVKAQAFFFSAEAWTLVSKQDEPPQRPLDEHPDAAECLMTTGLSPHASEIRSLSTQIIRNDKGAIAFLSSRELRGGDHAFLVPYWEDAAGPFLANRLYALGGPQGELLVPPLEVKSLLFQRVRAYLFTLQAVWEACGMETLRRLVEGEPEW